MKSKSRQKSREADEHLQSMVSGYGKTLTEITNSPAVLAAQFDSDQSPLRCWASRSFFVQAFQEPNEVIRLSVNRCKSGFAQGRTFADGISWDDLMEVKEQCGYGDRFAVEIYPERSNVVNVANMRHLWILRQPLIIGWTADGTDRTH